MSLPSFITSSNLSDTHGFFTRKGGYSGGIYTSLNCGPGSGDNTETVMQNRAAAMQALGFEDGSSLYSLYQIHSDKVIHLTQVPKERYQADALVTSTPGIALGILTADCTPVLFSDKQAGVIGAAHAGWKGAISGVLENTLLEMEKLGAKHHNIQVAIGPTIGQQSYEVGPEFYSRFLEEQQANAIFFFPSEKQGHYMFNLPGYVAARLAKAGVESIEDCMRDTCAEEENFFSYRRCCLKGEKDYGRNLSVIVIGDKNG